jgi:hypothetical protein
MGLSPPLSATGLWWIPKLALRILSYCILFSLVGGGRGTVTISVLRSKRSETEHTASKLSWQRTNTKNPVASATGFCLCSARIVTSTSQPAAG